MTKLRVLTGEHAGASLQLTHARMRVGPNEDLDVYIGDWNVQQIELQRDGTGRHVARWSASDDALTLDGQSPDGDGFQCVLEPWVPVRFGAVILCIGPADEAWPDDAQLLQRCFAPEPVAPPDRQPERRAPFSPLLMTAMTAAVVLISSTMLSRSEAIESRMPVGSEADAPSAAAPAADLQPLPVVADPVQQVREALEPGLRESLEIIAAADRVMVRGVLTSRSAVDELHRQLDRLPADLTVSRRVLSVSEIVDRLHESLPAAGLQVKHTGRSRFELSGTVDDVARATRAVQPVAADLGEFGLQIHIALQPRRTTVTTMSGMLIDGQGASFVRTRDGVKHIVSAAQSVASAGAVKVSPRQPNQLAPQAPETHHATR